MGLIPSQGTKIPHATATEVTTGEAMSYNEQSHMTQQRSYMLQLRHNVTNLIFLNPQGNTLNNFMWKVKWNINGKWPKLTQKDRKQIKTIRRSHLTPVRMTIMKKSTHNKCWRWYKEKGGLLHCCWGCKLVQPPRRTVWKFFKTLKTKQPLWSSNPTPVYILRVKQFEKTHVSQSSLQHYLQ